MWIFDWFRSRAWWQWLLLFFFSGGGAYVCWHYAQYGDAGFLAAIGIVIFCTDNTGLT